MSNGFSNNHSIEDEYDDGLNHSEDSYIDSQIDDEDSMINRDNQHHQYYFNQFGNRQTNSELNYIISSLNRNYHFTNPNNPHFEILSTESLNNRNIETKLDEIFDNLTYVFSSSRDALNKEKLKLMEEKKKFMRKRQEEFAKLENDKNILDDNRSLIESLLVNNENDVIDLDIGGTHKLTTTRKTLTKFKNSGLSLMFSGKHELKRHNGCVFIDRDGFVFNNLIYFLSKTNYFNV